jgi:hypothetical protein
VGVAAGTGVAVRIAAVAGVLVAVAGGVIGRAQPTSPASTASNKRAIVVDETRSYKGVVVTVFLLCMLGWVARVYVALAKSGSSVPHSGRPCSKKPANRARAC